MLSSKLYYRYCGKILLASAASIRYCDYGLIVSCLHRTSKLIFFFVNLVCLAGVHSVLLRFGLYFLILRLTGTLVILAQCFRVYDGYLL